MTDAAGAGKDKPKPICFVVMPISDADGYGAGHFGRVYEHLLKPAIADADYLAVRADDTNKTDYIVVGVVQKVVDSAIVLCDLSAKNPNVMYELGIRHAFNRPVVLIKDTATEKVFDIQGLRYTEYDPSLRVDTVQKDIAKIASAIRETAKADGDAFNSVVHLAGLTAAKVPDKQEVSPDTKIILGAIAALEQRVDSIDPNSKAGAGPNFFETPPKVVLSDGSEAEIGEEIFDGDKETVGTLVDVHRVTGDIFVKRKDGKIIRFPKVAIKAKGLTAVPF